MITFDSIKIFIDRHFNAKVQLRVAPRHAAKGSNAMAKKATKKKAVKKAAAKKPAAKKAKKK